MKSLKEFNFSLLTENGIYNDINGKELSFGNYGIYIKKNDPIEHTTYEEIEYSIQTSTGLTLIESKKDEYIDVLEKLMSLLDKKNISDEDIEYFLTAHLESKVSIRLGKKHFTTDEIEEINIGVNNGPNIQFKSSINELNALINMERSHIHDELVLFLKERYNKYDYNERIPLNEKKKLRKYFSSKNISTSAQVSKTENKIRKSKQEKSYEEMTVAQLRQIMKNKNLKPLTGKREDLISRIEASETIIDIPFK